MPLALKTLKKLLGDRLLIRPLSGPEKRGRILVPMTGAKKPEQSDIWWGVVESLGRDARFPDAYAIKVGDVVGIESLGRQCETIIGDDGEAHCWVAEEFLAAHDAGRVAAFTANEKWTKKDGGITPIGAYVLVRPEPEEESRGGIHLPHSAREPQKAGDVLAISAGEVVGDALAPLHVAAGMRVLYGRYSGAWAKLDEDLLLMKQENVIAELEPVKEAAHV